MDQLLLRGHLEQAEAAMQYEQNPDEWLLHQAWLHCLRGEYDQALEAGNAALNQARNVNHQRRLYFNNLAGVFLWLALLSDDSPQNLQQARQYAEILTKQPEHWLSLVYERLQTLIGVLLGELAPQAVFESILDFPKEMEHSLEKLTGLLCVYWVDQQEAGGLLDEAQAFCREAMEARISRMGSGGGDNCCAAGVRC